VVFLPTLYTNTDFIGGFIFGNEKSEKKSKLIIRPENQKRNYDTKDKLNPDKGIVRN